MSGRDEKPRAVIKREQNEDWDRATYEYWRREYERARTERRVGRIEREYWGNHDRQQAQLDIYETLFQHGTPITRQSTKWERFKGWCSRRRDTLEDVYYFLDAFFHQKSYVALLLAVIGNIGNLILTFLTGMLIVQLGVVMVSIPQIIFFTAVLKEEIGSEL